GGCPRHVVLPAHTGAWPGRRRGRTGPDAGLQPVEPVGLLPDPGGQGRVFHARVLSRPRPEPPQPAARPSTSRRNHAGAMVRRAASRAMSVRECTPSFFRMWETWVATVRRDSNSLAAISGLDSPSPTSAAILVSAGVRLSQ